MHEYSPGSDPPAAGRRRLHLDLDVAAGNGDYLAAHGVVVDFACNAAVAAALVGEHAFDLVVLDVQLPDRDVSRSIILATVECEIGYAGGATTPVS